MAGYEKFHGDVADMRDMAVRYNQNLLPYPVFGLVYGQSKAGTGLLSTQSLFPSAVYDNGYSRLIRHYQVDANSIPTYGSIQIISS